MNEKMEEGVFKTLKAAFALSSTQSSRTQDGDLQEHLTNAVKEIEKGSYKKAVEHIKEAIEITPCGPCRRKLLTAGASVLTLNTVCGISEEECKEEKDALMKKVEFLRDEFIPEATRLAEKAAEFENEQ